LNRGSHLEEGMDTQPAVRQNQILLFASGSNERVRLERKLEPANLEFAKILSGPDLPAEHVYFVDRGMISLVKPMQDGAAVEVGLIGREGFVGVAAVLGSSIPTVDQMVQNAGAARRINYCPPPARDGSKPHSLGSAPYVRSALFAQVAQTAACNGRHSVHERLARWLLWRVTVSTAIQCHSTTSCCR